MTQTIYLNQRGSRWILLEDGKKPKTIIQIPGGQQMKRTILYYESFGNWVVAAVRYKNVVHTYFEQYIDYACTIKGILIAPHLHIKKIK